MVPKSLQALVCVGSGAIALASLVLLQAPALSQGVFSDDDSGSLDGSSDSINSIFDIIHNENFRNDRSPQEIEQDRRTNIRNAIEDFHRNHSSPESPAEPAAADSNPTEDLMLTPTP